MSFIQKPAALALAFLPDPTDLLSPDAAAIALTAASGVPITSAGLLQASRKPNGPTFHRIGTAIYFAFGDALKWHTSERSPKGRKCHYSAATASLRELHDRKQNHNSERIGAM